jgi:DNA-binding NarL/FixJ family response regulator/anti-sigma regulatory factor (Ser/Thr protein kinase)
MMIEPTSDPRGEPPPRRIRVLVVDDATESRETLRRALAFDETIEVVGEAGSGREAIDRAGELRPDIILMDVTMPEGSGIEATQAITRRFPDTRVVALTAHEDPDTVRDMLRSGATGYVVKGAPVDELLEALHRAGQGEGTVDHRIMPMAVEDLRRLLREERDRREEVERLARNREEFVHVLAHELRTPLTVITGTLGYLERRDLSEEERELVGSSMDRVRQLQRLVEGLELIGAGSSDRGVAADPDRAVEQALERLGETADEVDAAPDSWLGVRPQHLARVIEELASNAFRHGRRPVRIRAFRQGNEGIVEVVDEGDFEPRAELFHAFVQADMSVTRERSGMGLGLFVASRLCEAEGGRLDLRREDGRTVAEARFLLAG